MQSLDHQLGSKPLSFHRDTCKKATRSLCAKDSFPALKRNMGKAKSDDLHLAIEAKFDLGYDGQN